MPKEKKQKKGASIREAAKHFSVSERTIQAWKSKHWTAHHPDGSIDLEATAAQVDAVRDVRGGKADRGIGLPQEYGEPGQDEPQVSPEKEGAAPPNVSTKEARRRKEYWQAVKAELEARRLQEELISVDDAARVYTGIIGTAKANLEALPTRVAPRLVGLSDTGQIRAILADEIASALREVSNDAPALSH